MGELVLMVFVKEYTTFSVSDFTGDMPYNSLQSPADIHVCSGLSEVSVILRYAQFY